MSLSFTVPTPKVVLLSGNTHRPSKSHGLAALLGERLADKIEVSVTHLDLVDAGAGLGTAYYRSQLSNEARHVIEGIEAADALIVTTPVYKGSYPGLFKHLIDLLDVDALVNTPVLVGATGGGYRHALVVEHHLRPLFGFFSALVNPTTVYVSDHEFTDGKPSDPQVLKRIDLAVDQFARLIEAQLYKRQALSMAEAEVFGLAASNA